MASPVRNEAAPIAKPRRHSGSVRAAEYIIPLRDARRNCLNFKGVIANKLVAAPRYQLSSVAAGLLPVAPIKTGFVSRPRCASAGFLRATISMCPANYYLVTRE
jgi:hypothetical protein